MSSPVCFSISFVFHKYESLSSRTDSDVSLLFPYLPVPEAPSAEDLAAAEESTEVSAEGGMFFVPSC